MEWDVVIKWGVLGPQLTFSLQSSLMESAVWQCVVMVKDSLVGEQFWSQDKLAVSDVPVLGYKTSGWQSEQVRQILGSLSLRCQKKKTKTVSTFDFHIWTFWGWAESGDFHCIVWHFISRSHWKTHFQSPVIPLFIHSSSSSTHSKVL
jgi:hypothetical protein